jgi:phage terminase large subunit GpA-like protein
LNLANPHKVRTGKLVEGLQPDDLLELDEWSDRHRVLSTKASAEPGTWKTERTPYLREIMKCLSDHNPVQKIIFMKSSQIGGSETGNNWVGYIIDQSPSPTLILQPNEGLAKRYSKQRLDPMINESPRLRGKIVSKNARDSRNTLLMKEFNGGFLIIAGAVAASGLKSMPIKNLFLDEIDSYPDDVEQEGDPVELAEARTRTYARRKIFKNSTPTMEGRSRVANEYAQTDQRKYFVPCPHCDHFQILRWSNVRWPKNEPHKAEYECEDCHALIPEYHKTKMLERGEWRPTNLNHTNPKVAGFHISALYSPVGWFSWSDAAEQFIKAKDNPLKLMVFVNTVLGETWKEQGDAPDWEDIYRRREKYPIGRIPNGVLFLTAGADVQKDRIEMEVVGWGRNGESWSVDYIEITGDTSTSEPYDELDTILLHQKFSFADNEKVSLGIKALAIDSGYNTQSVYNWARKHPTRVMAIKGSKSQPTILSGGKPIDVNYKGQVHKRGVKLWHVGVSVAKIEFYGWLRQKPPLEAGKKFKFGFCHFPEYQAEYFRMLTAEQLRMRKVKGHPVYEWHKVHERNEALDARVYARAAASLVGFDRFDVHNWEELENSIKELKRTESPGDDPGKSATTQTKGGIPVRRSKFWGD